MLIYPENPKPLTPLEYSSLHDIIENDISFGVYTRRRRSLRKKRIVNLNYEWLKKDELSILYNFYNEVQEDTGEFLFKFPTELEWKKEFVAKVTDVQTQSEFELPVADGWTSLTVYVNGAVVTDYTTTIDTTRSQRPILSFATSTVTLNNGDVITCDFIGKPFLYFKFDEFSIGVEMMLAGYTNIKDLGLIEIFKDNIVPPPLA